MHSEALSSLPLPALEWDVFCRVVDNFGDIGVCWRLARRLAILGQRVRLWTDDESALAWMAPEGAPGVSVLPWREPLAAQMPGDVVVEAFGCDPPAGFVERMAAAVKAPVWINLEHLSAEAFVERSHALPSPQLAGPGRGLLKWFFYPGFAARTGGLLREDDLDAEKARFEPAGWLASLDIGMVPGAQRVSLFCYRQPALGAWLAHWQAVPTQLLVTPGLAAEQVSRELGCGGAPGSTLVRGALHAHFLPWLTQPAFDRLLWACDLNLVRGEDSLVRALWAARPFVWQLYPQSGGVHEAKLDAFLGVYLRGAETEMAQTLRRHFAQCNGFVAGPGGPDLTGLHAAAWRSLAAERSAELAQGAAREGDLAWRLCRFAASKG
jgi:uncharacterized repeat protein (TIGR03837 family)